MPKLECYGGPLDGQTRRATPVRFVIPDSADENRKHLYQMGPSVHRPHARVWRYCGVLPPTAEVPADASP